MISAFLGPAGTLICGFGYTKLLYYFKNQRKTITFEHIFKIEIGEFGTSKFGNLSILEMFEYLNLGTCNFEQLGTLILNFEISKLLNFETS